MAEVDQAALDEAVRRFPGLLKAARGYVAVHGTLFGAPLWSGWVRGVTAEYRLIVAERGKRREVGR